ncbi:MAG: 50S ribosomal protein L31e [Thaumarchaeota archaeon]|nr:MAG: 50S ribosomal protein L31e [Nitrososphaerota archaeon]
MSGEVLERLYVIPLRDAYEASRTRRAKKAINIIKKFAQRHMKGEDIRISEGVNHAIWSRGAEKPPRRITVVIRKDESGTIWVMLPTEAERKKS